MLKSVLPSQDFTRARCSVSTKNTPKTYLKIWVLTRKDGDDLRWYIHHNTLGDSSPILQVMNSSVSNSHSPVPGTRGILMALCLLSFSEVEIQSRIFSRLWSLRSFSIILVCSACSYQFRETQRWWKTRIVALRKGKHLEDAWFSKKVNSSLRAKTRNIAHYLGLKVQALLCYC